MSAVQPDSDGLPPREGWKVGTIQRFTHEPHVEPPPRPSTSKKLVRIFAVQAGIALPASNPTPRWYFTDTIEVHTADGVVQTWVYSGPSVASVGKKFYYREDGNKRVVESEHQPTTTYEFEVKVSN